MIEIRHSDDRGASQTSWLDSRFSFSFADYLDRDQMGFRSLRVLNEDWIAPGTGFGAHPHRDMEILTFPIEGTLEHRDSEGSLSRLTPGRVQLMSAGTGIVHSEVNPSHDESLHLLQVWILPDGPGHPPRHQEMDLERMGALTPLVTPDGRDGTLAIHQDVSVHALGLEAGEAVEYDLAPGRHAWVQVATGELLAGEARLEAGDGAAVSDESVLRLASEQGAEALVFDLA